MKLRKNILKTAEKVLNNESLALAKLSSALDEGFVGAVKSILSVKGRVIITGIGKSAIIANKIVATMNSTGTPALFMHAADAIHGDLGMITKEDIVLCISKSGNTPEIKVLVPLIKRTGVKLIALVCERKSYLAIQSDFAIVTEIEEEACPNNLAPTTSTAVHMAAGDALAVCVLQEKGFSSKDFAKLHPGGSLGKRLYLKVEDIYVNNEKPIVHINTPLSEVIFEISSKRLGAAAVVEDDGKLVGVITDGDLRRMLESNSDIKKLKAGDIMGTHPKVINPDSFAVDALNIMQERSITQLIVTRDGKPEGFIHLHDLLREGIV